MSAQLSAPFHNPKLEHPSLMRAIVSPASRDSRPEKCSLQNAQCSLLNVPQTEFNWVYPHNYPLLLVSEVAEQFNISESQVRKLADDASIVAFHINVADEPHREHLRIIRSTCERGIARSLSGIVDLWRTVPDWVLPGLGARQTLNVYDIAKALRITGEHVRQLNDGEKLHGSSASVSTASLEHLRFHRGDLIHFVRSRLALKNNLTPKDLEALTRKDVARAAST
jgi:hypothetical protein